jgi:putative membrane protein
MAGTIISSDSVVAAVVYAALGMGVYSVGFWVLDLCTPKVAIWKELVEKQNMAIAVFLSAVSIGIALIIAAAIQG